MHHQGNFAIQVMTKANSDRRYDKNCSQLGGVCGLGNFALLGASRISKGKGQGMQGKLPGKDENEFRSSRGPEPGSVCACERKAPKGETPQGHPNNFKESKPNLQKPKLRGTYRRQGNLNRTGEGFNGVPPGWLYGSSYSVPD